MTSARGSAWLLTALLLAAALAAGCSRGGGPGEDGVVLAVVEGRPVTLTAYEKRLGFLNLGFANMSGPGHDGADAKLEVVMQLVEEELYLIEARRAGVAATDSEVDAAMEKAEADLPDGEFGRALERGGLTEEDFRDEAARKLTVEKLIRAEVYSKVRVDESAAREYFDANRAAFSRPMRVRARQVVVGSEAEAREILSELKSGADFAETAQKRSSSPDAEAGGDLGYFARGEMPPEFEDAVFGMKPGRISPVVKSPYGYHIFRVEDVQEPLRPSFEEARQEVEAALRAKAGEEAYRAWQAGLKKKAAIELNSEAIRRL